MNSIRLIKKKIFAFLFLFFTVAVVFGQNSNNTGSSNADLSGVTILFIIMTVVLAFVIWGLGQVLLVVSRQLVNKSKKSDNATILLLIAFLLISTGISAQDNAAAQQVVETAGNYGGLSEFTFYMFVSVLVAEVVAIFFLTLSIFRINGELNPSPKKKVADEVESTFQAWWSRMDKKLFTKAIPVEREADVLLDHNYDGIKELDNSLPPWWKYGFYITIFIGIIYLFNFHVFGSGKNPDEEYTAEMDQAQIEKEIYESKNKDKIDENNLPIADATGLTIAKNIFIGKCAACHAPDGGGGAGPNLTDDYWIHNGSLNAIYKSIKVGYPDKGMQSWLTVYTPKEISYLASYVKTLHGTKPQNPKAPQGDFYTEQGGVQPLKDSAGAAPSDTQSKSLSKK